MNRAPINKPLADRFNNAVEFGKSATEAVNQTGSYEPEKPKATASKKAKPRAGRPPRVADENSTELEKLLYADDVVKANFECPSSFKVRINQFVMSTQLPENKKGRKFSSIREFYLQCILDGMEKYKPK